MKGSIARSFCLGVALLVACGGEPDPPELDARSVDRLRALGYLDYAETVDDDRDGVTLLDPERWFAGYTLYTVRSRCLAELVDPDGRVARRWTRPCRVWARAELLPTGELLVIGRERTSDESLEGIQRSRFLMKLGWDGELVWTRPIPAHHDVELTPDGRLLTLVHRFRDIPKIHPTLPVDDDGIALLSADGEVIEEASLYDVLDRSGRFTPRVPLVHTDRVDLLHANSVEWMRVLDGVPNAPLYRPSNVLVCIRNQDAVVVIDWETKELVWAWGPGELSGPHDATLLDDGHVLIFDNGVKRGRSRVVEVDPLARRIVWEHMAEGFFTRERGSSQRLPNGNTLVSSSAQGFGFEVTPSGNRVWQLAVPYRDARGRRATIVRMRRLPASAVEAIDRSVEAP